MKLSPFDSRDVYIGNDTLLLSVSPSTQIDELKKNPKSFLEFISLVCNMHGVKQKQVEHNSCMREILNGQNISYAQIDTLDNLKKALSKFYTCMIVLPNFGGYNKWKPSDDIVNHKSNKAIAGKYHVYMAIDERLFVNKDSNCNNNNNNSKEKGFVFLDPKGEPVHFPESDFIWIEEIWCITGKRKTNCNSESSKKLNFCLLMKSLYKYVNELRKPCDLKPCECSPSSIETSDCECDCDSDNNSETDPCTPQPCDSGQDDGDHCDDDDDEDHCEDDDDDDHCDDDTPIPSDGDDTPTPSDGDDTPIPSDGDDTPIPSDGDDDEDITPMHRI